MCRHFGCRHFGCVAVLVVAVLDVSPFWICRRFDRYPTVQIRTIAPLRPLVALGETLQGESRLAETRGIPWEAERQSEVRANGGTGGDGQTRRRRDESDLSGCHEYPA